MPSNRVAVFDLDGTLVDTTYLHALAWWRAACELGSPRPFSAFHRLIGMGSDQLLDEVVPDLDDAARHRLDDGHSEQFERLHDEVRPLPGAADLLRELKRRGWVVAVATSGKPADVDHALDVLDVRDAIDVEVNSSEADESKPAPDIFALALERTGASPGDAVVVGDTIWDVRAAVRCGIPAIGVLTGGHATQDLVGEGASSVHADCGALLDALDGTLLGAGRGAQDPSSSASSS
jgi:HAD superfamily hydrolase (TIGR01509 family)